MQIQKNRRLVIVAMFLTLSVFFVLYIKGRIETHSISGVPSEVSNLFYNYMKSFKKGTHVSVDYVYFIDDFKRNAYIDSGDKLLDYRVEKVEKINDQLYSFTLLMKTKLSMYYSGNAYERAYNFAAYINSKWYYLNGVSNIPPELRNNLDENNYVYDDKNIVDASDIVGVISLD